MKEFSFLTVGKTSETHEAAEIKRYIGVGTCQVVAINPTSAEITQFMGYTPKEEPVYTGTTEVDNKNVATARVTFILKTVPDKCNGIDTTVMLSYNLQNRYVQGATSGKYHVVDDYGRDAWATKEVIESKSKIMYKEGTMEANIDKEYHPAYVGEIDLVNFLRRFLNVPQPANYINGSWVNKTGAELNDAKLHLDDIQKYFKGDFTEIKDAIELQPMNKIKALFGIRTNDEGREYQEVYSTVLSANANDSAILRLSNDIADRKANGGLSHDTFEFTPIHEYSVEPTNFEENSASTTETTSENPW